MFTYGSRRRKAVGVLGALLSLFAALFLFFTAVPLEEVSWLLKVIIWITLVVYLGMAVMLARWAFRRSPAPSARVR